MGQQLQPQRGQWYFRNDLNEPFEVVAIDEDEGTIEVQYFTGEIEEFDQASWLLLELSNAAEPEDWSGALEVDDYSLNDRHKSGPTSLDEALYTLDSYDI